MDAVVWVKIGRRSSDRGGRRENVEKSGGSQRKRLVRGGFNRQVNNVQELDLAKLGQADNAHSVMARGGAWKRPREIEVNSAAMEITRTDCR